MISNDIIAEINKEIAKIKAKKEEELRLAEQKRIAQEKAAQEAAAAKKRASSQKTKAVYTNYSAKSGQGRLTLMTAYSSSLDETSGNPFITASGARTHWGVVAANHLPLGTKIKIPSLFGDQVFTVLDRMHPKNYGKVDVWFPSKSQAIQFGVRRAEVVVL